MVSPLYNIIFLLQSHFIVVLLDYDNAYVHMLRENFANRVGILNMNLVSILGFNFILKNMEIQNVFSQRALNKNIKRKQEILRADLIA